MPRRPRSRNPQSPVGPAPAPVMIPRGPPKPDEVIHLPLRSVPGAQPPTAPRVAQVAEQGVYTGVGQEHQGGQRSRQSGRRGQQYNHLLGFTLPPRAPAPLPAQAHLPRRSKRNGGGPGELRSQERFVMSIYRFVLRPTGDYSAHFADADVPLNWSDVLQVIIPTSAPVVAPGADPFNIVSDVDETPKFACPICLCEPEAPRVTKCGHVFCYPCLLHYLAVASAPHSKWYKCPVCAEAIHSKDVKSVKFLPEPLPPSPQSLPLPSSNSQPHHDPVPPSNPDNLPTITMRLIQRPQLTTLALPRSRTWPSDAVPPLSAPWCFIPDVLRFARFVLATPEYMINELERDMDQLHQNSRAANGGPPIPAGEEDLNESFRQAARAKVLEQMEKARIMGEAGVSGLYERASKALEELQVVHDVEAGSSSSSGAAGSSSSSTVPSSAAVPPTAPTASRRRGNINPPPPSDSMFYFYQASTGHSLFLHPLDIKILKSHYGSYARFPTQITVPVEGLEEVSMTEEVRKKFRYLDHLPGGTVLTFVESDLSEIVAVGGGEGESSTGPYDRAIKARRQARKERERREERERAKGEQREKERERQERRSYANGAFGTGNGGMGYGAAAPVAVETDAKEFLEWLTWEEREQDAVSDTARSVDQPDRTSGRRSQPTPAPTSARPLPASGPRTVWGTPAVATQRNGRSSSADRDGDYEDEEYPNWAAAFDAPLPGLGDENMGRGSKKGKKNKKVVVQIAGGRGAPGGSGRR